MARIRTIKPTFWEDELVGSMSTRTRLVFVGLFSLADDAGRLRGNAAWIRSQLFAYDEDTTAAAVEASLRELHNARRIRLYGNGQRYVEVTNFLKHQRIQKPQPSQIPAPGGHYKVEPIEGGDEQDILVPVEDQSATVPVRKGREEEEERDEANASRRPSGPTAEQVRGVFDTWCRLFHRNANTKLDEKRRARIRWALTTYDARIVWHVLQGYAADPWRHEATSRNEVRTLLRDAASIERGLELYDERRGGGGGSDVERMGY